MATPSTTFFPLIFVCIFEINRIDALLKVSLIFHDTSLFVRNETLAFFSSCGPSGDLLFISVVIEREVETRKRLVFFYTV